MPQLLTYLSTSVKAFFHSSKTPIQAGRRTACSPAPPVCVPRLIDTSVLIDGRIAEVADCGFLSGEWILTEFVLRELQLVADSSDSSRRNRGRRGLEVVDHLRQAKEMIVCVSSIDYPKISEVDLKLIAAAKELGAHLVTTDFKLNRLAKTQGVRVLNVNELAMALRPVVLQGESLRVFIAREGKDPGQGVAFLEDGTMIVVENARRHIGSTVNITVASVLQSAAGKMIFGRCDGSLKARRKL